MLYIKDLTDQFDIDGYIRIKIFGYDEETDSSELIKEKAYGSIYAVPEEYTSMPILAMYADKDELVIEIDSDW